MLIFWERFNGLIERFSLFHQYNFGWAVPLFSPEALLGMVRDSALNPWPLLFRVGLSVAVLALWVAGLFGLASRQKPRALAALALVLPVMAGWSLLAAESRMRPNASYDAYKLISVFLPGLIAGLLSWLAAVRWRSWDVKIGAAVLLGFMLAANLVVGGHFRRRMAIPPLRANRNIAELAVLEKDSRFISFNMLIDDYWSRLWANAFLLRRPQYFLTHTYEGRLNTALKGEWDLRDSLLRPIPLAPDDFLQFNVRFFLVRAAAAGLLQMSYGDGWYGEERSGPKRWRWSDGQGRIVIVNPTGFPVRVQLRMLVQSFLTRDLTIRLGSQVIATKPLDGTSQVLEFDEFPLPPGQSILTFAGKATSPGVVDERQLCFALYGLELRTLAVEKSPR
jgi:hypothetical protein